MQVQNQLSLLPMYLFSGIEHFQVLNLYGIFYFDGNSIQPPKLVEIFYGHQSQKKHRLEKAFEKDHHRHRNYLILELLLNQGDVIIGLEDLINFNYVWVIQFFENIDFIHYLLDIFDVLFWEYFGSSPGRIRQSLLLYFINASKRTLT